MIPVQDCPMNVLQVVWSALSDTRITTGTSYHVLKAIAEHADENGNIHPGADGQLITDPKVLAAKLGVSVNPIYKAFRTLRSLNYISWQEASRGVERTQGMSGKVSIIVPQAQ
jgi:hypothetical protein